MNWKGARIKANVRTLSLFRQARVVFRTTLNSLTIQVTWNLIEHHIHEVSRNTRVFHRKLRAQESLSIQTKHVYLEE